MLTSVRFSRASCRASSGVSVPTRPSVILRWRFSTVRYLMMDDATPVGIMRTPKPLSSVSQRLCSPDWSGSSASTMRLVSFGKA